MSNKSRKGGLAYFHRYRAKKRIALAEIKTSSGCSNCNENDHRCLQFHHRDPSTKSYSISRLYAGTWGMKRILEEIEKCVILCANCHLKLHHREDEEGNERINGS